MDNPHRRFGITSPDVFRGLEIVLSRIVCCQDESVWNCTHYLWNTSWEWQNLHWWVWRPFKDKKKEHQKLALLGGATKSRLIQHGWEEGHRIKWNDACIISKAEGWRQRTLEGASVKKSLDIRNVWTHIMIFEMRRSYMGQIDSDILSNTVWQRTVILRTTSNPLKTTGKVQSKHRGELSTLITQISQQKIFVCWFP